MNRILNLTCFTSITWYALLGCQTLEVQDAKTAEPAAQSEADISHEEIDDAIDAVSVTEEPVKGPDDEIEIIGQEQAKVPRGMNDSLTDNIPEEYAPAVQKWIEFYLRYPKTISQFISRGAKYKPMIERILRDQGLPTDFYYLAMIESGFEPKAKSNAKAVGIWQFISGTAKRYGLLVDFYVDERQDPVRATVAAGLYLNDLNNVFQSWYLTMAAYNAGEVRIMNAIMKGKSRDFWSLGSSGLLPQETMEYVPKFIAVALMAKNPSKYGLEVVPEKPIDVAAFRVNAPTSFKALASLTDVSRELMRELNPHLLRELTPPGISDYKLWVPRESLSLFESKADEIAFHRVHFKNQIGTKTDASKGDIAELVSPSGTIHIVKSGETLRKLSRRFGVKVSELKAMNHLQNSKIYPNQKLIVSKAAVASNKPSYHRYRVRHGDNLESIAKRFGVEIEQLKRINQIKKSAIYVGQVLKIEKLAI